MTKHKVKSWAHFFDAIKAGTKLHDLRKLDRDYKVGDILVLQRYDNINGEYTGEELEAEITYITSSKVPCAFSSSALDKEYGIFSLKTQAKRSDAPERFIPLDPNRNPKIVIKSGPDPLFATGGRVKAGIPYFLGEQRLSHTLGIAGKDGISETYVDDHPQDTVGQYRG